MPKVSIIVPCYNVAPYVARCLDSLINQTLCDIEIICIDDKSTDDTLKILSEYAQQDERITLIKHATNTGVAIARNDGMNIATGKYIGFVDPDDYVDLDFYEKLYNKAIETGADIIRGDFIQIDVKTNNITHHKVNDLSDFIGAFWSAIYKSDFLAKHNITFPPHIRTSQDSVFLTMVVLAMPVVDYVSNTSYHYFYQNLGSLDSNFLTPAKAKSKYDAFCMNLELIESANISQSQRTKFIKTHVINNILYEKDKSFECLADRKMMLELLNNICQKYNICTNKKRPRKIFYKECTKHRVHIYLCGIKIISYKKKHHINSYINNKIIIIKDGVESVLTAHQIKGLNIVINGNNNIIKLHMPIVAQKCDILIENDNTYIEIGSSPNLQYLKIHAAHGIGQVCKIGNGTTVYGATIKLCENAGCIIGYDCMLSNSINIWATDGHSVLDNTTGKILNHATTPVIIGNHVWIGEGVRITKRAHIHDNSICAGGAVCYHDYVESNVIIAGNPGQIVKRNINWARPNPYKLENPELG